MFPADRYAHAGASPEELDTLQTEYDRLPPLAQQQHDARLAALPESGLRDELDALRARPAAQEEEPEEDEPPETVKLTPDTPDSGGLKLSDGSTVGGDPE